MKRIRIQVFGRVQGVGFRYFTRSTAMEMGVTGWVRNMYDGSVEMEAQADEGKLEAFAAAVRQGPRFSNVSKLLRNDESIVEGEKSFRVRG